MLVLGGACLALLLLLRLWLEVVGALPGERAIDARVPDLGSLPGLHDLNLFFQAAGTPALALLTVPVALWFSWRAAGWRAALLVAVATFGVLVNAALKELSGPTPLMRELHSAASLNYPSGHTAYAALLCGSLAWIAWPRRRDIAFVLLALAGAMGVSRITIGAHFVSDVMAGYLFAVVWLLLSASVTLPRRKNPQGAGSAASPG